MGLPAIDWNEVWRKMHAERPAPLHDRGFWDQRAPEFTRHATAGDYILQFVQIMEPKPDWSVLDVGCGAGTLAVPLAPRVADITAMDPSTGMRTLLEERCRNQGIDNICIVEGGWQDDWVALGIGTHDVAIASRSLLVEDLRGAILKLQKHARKRVYLATLVDDGPYDRGIVEAVGRKLSLGADYIVVYNLLRQMGIYANAAFTVTRQEKSFADLEEAVDGLRWMIHAMTPAEEARLREYLARCLVRENGRWRLPQARVVRWAVLWWATDETQQVR